jgi:AP-4 complex subunit mu-1
MFSQIFILSPRGDTIINRDFRSDLPKSAPETFFRWAKSAKGDATPLGAVDGIMFGHIKRGGIYY